MIWIVLIAVILGLVFGPMLWVRYVMAKHATHIDGMPGTGGELAEHLLTKFELGDVKVKAHPAGDFYDPSAREVCLSESNFKGKSLTAVAVAAHEVGHAIQHAQEDKRLQARTKLIPFAESVARISTGMLWAAPIIGALTRHPVPLSVLFLAGLSGLVVRMLVHLVTLPIEWDASFGKALPVLVEGQYIAPGEERAITQILRAAAFTYVASALADVLNLARWLALLFRSVR